MNFQTPPALLLIDIQQGFKETAYYGGNRNNPDAEIKAGELLNCWRKKEWPVFHIHHHSMNPESPLYFEKEGAAPHNSVIPRPGEPVYKKSVHSAFLHSELKEDLEAQNAENLIFAGITTNHCVSTNVRLANNLGFKCWVVRDATAAFDQKGPEQETLDANLIHKAALASLQYEFAQLTTTRELIQSAEGGEFPMV